MENAYLHFVLDTSMHSGSANIEPCRKRIRIILGVCGITPRWPARATRMMIRMTKREPMAGSVLCFVFEPTGRQGQDTRSEIL